MRLPVILVLENVRSAHNVGAVIRTAEAAGIEELILGPLSPWPGRGAVDKTALGNQHRLPWRGVSDIKNELLALKNRGYTLCALEITPKSQDVYLVQQIPSPIVLVVGHEREGVTQEILDLCSHHYHLPMRGEGNSLNVSNAVAVALYEVTRRLCYN